jgi:hypothetical protein
MMPKQEEVGKRFFEIMGEAGKRFSLADLLILRSAFQGKVAWEELPDYIRVAFYGVADRVSSFVGYTNTSGR